MSEDKAVKHMFEYAVYCGLRPLAAAIKLSLPSSFPQTAAEHFWMLQFTLMASESLPENLIQVLNSLNRLTPSMFDRGVDSTFFNVTTSFRIQAVRNCQNLEMAEHILRDQFTEADESGTIDSVEKQALLREVHEQCQKYVYAEESDDFKQKFVRDYDWHEFVESTGQFLDNLAEVINIERIPLFAQIYIEKLSVDHEKQFSECKMHSTATSPLSPTRNQIKVLQQQVAELKNGDPLAEVLTISAQAVGDSEEESPRQRPRRFDVSAPDAEKVLWSEESETPPITLSTPKIDRRLKRALSVVPTRDIVVSSENTQKRRVRWTPEEVAALTVGVGQFGRSWKEILEGGGFLPFRTTVDLKDKWRNLEKSERSHKS